MLCWERAFDSNILVIVDDYTGMAQSVFLLEKDIRQACEHRYTGAASIQDAVNDFSAMRLRADSGKEFIVYDMKRKEKTSEPSCSSRWPLPTTKTK